MNIAHDEEELDWMGSNCWFCGQRPPVRGKSYFVKMKKMTEAPGNRVGILRSSVAVPRCAECAAGHQRVTMGYFKGAIIGALAVFLIVVVWQPIEMAGWVQGLLVLAGLVVGSALMGNMIGLPRGQKPESSAEGFAAVEAMRVGGWMKDDLP